MACMCALFSREILQAGAAKGLKTKHSHSTVVVMPAKWLLAQLVVTTSRLFLDASVLIKQIDSPYAKSITGPVAGAGGCGGVGEGGGG